MKNNAAVLFVLLIAMLVCFYIVFYVMGDTPNFGNNTKNILFGSDSDYKRSVTFNYRYVPINVRTRTGVNVKQVTPINSGISTYVIENNSSVTNGLERKRLTTPYQNHNNTTNSISDVYSSTHTIQKGIESDQGRDRSLIYMAGYQSFNTKNSGKSGTTSGNYGENSGLYAYNSGRNGNQPVLSNMFKTMGMNTGDSEEDPFDPGGGSDNEGYYNDVPIGDGTMIFVALLGIYIFFKFLGIRKCRAVCGEEIKMIKNTFNSSIIRNKENKVFYAVHKCIKSDCLY